MTKTFFGAALALTVMMVGCGDGIGDVTTAGPSATPTPRPGASPTPTPVPTPTPTPTPRPGALSCSLPSLPICDAACCSSGGPNLFRNEVETAEDDLVRSQPGLFLPNGNVKDKFAYLDALAKRLTELTGLCAVANGHDELRIKKDQTVSNHVDVLIGDETPWVGGIYTCRPASF